jgi:signal transduction histidine kinase
MVWQFIKKYSVYLQMALFLALIYSLHFYNYLLFHSFAELLSVVVAFTIFILAWNSRDYFDNKILFFYAMAMLPLAVIDTLHTFAFKGVSIFEGITANEPTQLWLIGRYFFSISLLAAPFVAEKIQKKENILYGMVAALAVVLVSFFTFGFFPDAYIEGTGLTPFKIYSEYAFILMMGGALYGLYRQKGRFDREVYRYVTLAIGAAIVSEFMFTLYFAVTDEFNLLGHLFKIVTFLFFYTGIVEINMMQPYRLMFKNLNDLNIAKSEFLSIASHQLKNPLSIILLTTDVMKMDTPLSADTSAHHAYLNDISGAVTRMKKIIDTLLNAAKIELGVAKVHEEDISLAPFIRENIEELERLAQEKNLSIVDDLDERDLPDITSDRQLLSIVFENILSNAIKYSKPGGTVTVSITLSPHLAIHVKDTGYGIPEHQQSQILRNNFRGDNIAQTVKDGTGLGLYMVKKIADKIGLDISFTSKENEGTMFTITFIKP